MTEAKHRTSTTYEVVCVDPRGDCYIYGGHPSLEAAQKDPQYSQADFIMKRYPNGDTEDVWVSKDYTARREQERAEARRLLSLLRDIGSVSLDRIEVEPQSDWASMNIRIRTKSWFRFHDLQEALAQRDTQ